ncbi:iron uptake porin [Chamaesiphon sp. VAR_48_metabat_403]|uniref:iron uptake porin n=1 Tax=Chamaesiphon sp. VAR_48_metabat_403 TaxID=2964700 RepID=UPI00286E44FC|nr:iron uptake porin [Chamaesiphon sp. VAR_48_metabat_403]
MAIAVWVASVSPVGANPVAETNTEQIEQATQATEIKPGDWAYQTLQALSSKYSCGNTPKDNKVLSREEFATSLNGCVQSIEELVARRPRRAVKKRKVVPAPSIVTPPPAAPEITTPPAPTPVEPPAPQVEQEEVVSQQDLDRLKGLVQSFSAELQGVDSRLQAAEDKVTKLQAQSFSTTTKLNGEAIFAFSGYNTGRSAGVGTNGTTANTLSDRVRLNFDTSFTGKDRLRTRLESRNTPQFNSGVTGTNMTRLGFDGDSTNNTSVALLNYGFPISPETRITVDVVGARFNDHLYTFNPILTSSGSGAISRFGRFNPVYRLSTEGSALTVNHKFSNELDFAIGYAVPNINAAASTAQGSGLFSGSNAIISQLNIRPAKDLNLGLVYGRAYTTNGGNINGGTGSIAANSPFGAVPTSANYYSFQTSYKLSPSFVLSGWAGFTEANRETAAGGNASTSNYAISFAFPDFGQKGNNLAFIVGIPPKLNSRTGTGLGAANAQSPSTTATTQGNPDTSYHIEALYRVKLSDNLAITPGLLLITNPEHNRANPTEYVGTIRSTFTF